MILFIIYLIGFILVYAWYNIFNRAERNWRGVITSFIFALGSWFFILGNLMEMFTPNEKSWWNNKPPKWFPLLFLFFISCTSPRYLDQQEQVILIDAFKEKKQQACGLPRHLRTWHVDIVNKKGDTLSYHYHTESFAKQRWLIPGDKYTVRYTLKDSIHCGKYALVYADLKRNE